MPRRKRKSSAHKDHDTFDQQIDKNRGTSPDASGIPTRQGIQAELAKFYVKWFVWIVAGTLAFTLIFCFNMNDIKDILLAVSGVLSGPLGFIIGYYFKEEHQKEK